MAAAIAAIIAGGAIFTYRTVRVKGRARDKVVLTALRMAALALVVFCLFRLAAILHGIKGRLARGNASSAHAAQMVERLESLADLAWNEVQHAEL